jgi:hypothetical protein
MGPEIPIIDAGGMAVGIAFPHTAQSIAGGLQISSEPAEVNIATSTSVKRRCPGASTGPG